MLNEKVVALLNQQVNKELYSAYLYLAIANYYEEQSLDGYQNWYEIQAKEEMDHALLFIKYLQNNSAHIELEAIDKPIVNFENYLEPLKLALNHEYYVTSLIHDLYAEASAHHDYRTMKFLDWFIDEQGEEEKNATDMVSKFELFGSDAKSLYDLNNEYKSRAYSAPSLQLD